MSEKNCMKCQVFWFKESLCKGGFCDEYWAEGKADDFINVIKPKWISCSEKLPDKGLRVLMQLNNAWQIVGWYDVEDSQWFELIYAEPVANDRVLAWMELPPDYKGDIK